MKTFAIAAIALVSFGFTSSASAFKFSPPTTFFGLQGSFSLTKGGTTVPCNTAWQFKTSATGGGKVKGTTFVGSAACQAIQGVSNRPWKTRAASAGSANISGMAFSTSLGTCGPSTAPFTLNGSGVVTFSSVPLAGGCMVSGSLQSQPVLSIVPN